MGLISRVSSRTYRQKMPFRSASEDRRTLFCKGLPPNVETRDLEELDCFKTAVNFRIVRHQDGTAKGFCYIVFDTEDDADATYEDRFNCRMSTGRDLYLDYVGEKSKHQPPPRRRSPSPYRRSRYSRSRSRDRYRRDSRDRYDRRDRSRSRDRRSRSRGYRR